MPDQIAAYLFACEGDLTEAAPGSVFFLARSTACAAALCELFAQEYAALNRRFGWEPAARIPLERQVLLNEALGQVELLGDPDQGVYEFNVPILYRQRAEWARRAESWQANLPSQESHTPAPDPKSKPQTVATELDRGLQQLLGALDWHRLLFLFSADACRRNPMAISGPTGINERIDRDEVLGWKEMMADADEYGRFILDHRDVIDRYAEAAVQAFGPGEGVRPTVLDSQGLHIPVGGASLPYWSLRDWTSRHLEDSSDAILNACRAVAVADPESRATDVVRSSMEVSRADNHTKWTPSIIVHWNYLARLDAALQRVKQTRVQVAVSSSRCANSALVQEPPEPNPQNLTDLVVLFMLTRDLIRTFRDYPDALPADDQKCWLEEITSWTARVLELPAFEKFNKLACSPELKELDVPNRFGTLMSLALLGHPTLSSLPEAPADIQVAVEKALQTCQESASPRAKQMVSRMADLMFVVCRSPTGKDVKDFVDPARYFQMLHRYWRLVSELVQIEAHTEVAFRPHPLLHVIENLRDRLHTCFNNLGDIPDKVEIASVCDMLAGMLTEGDFDDLSALPEWSDGEIQKVERFIAKARLKMWSRNYSLTAAEEYFIGQCAHLITEHRKRLKAEWQKVLARADANVAHHKQGASPGEVNGVLAKEPAPPPAPGPTVPAVVLGRQGEHCTVRGNRKEPLTKTQYALIQALINAADEGLRKDDLERISPGARDSLKRLRRDSDWSVVIQMAGATNKRYRILR